MERPKALLVEDNDNNRYLLKLLLEAANIAVVVAVNGHHALELARTERPDCILLAGCGKTANSGRFRHLISAESMRKAHCTA